MQLPRTTSEKYAYIIASTVGSLPSALNDAIAHTVTWINLNFKVHLFLDTESDIKAYQSRIRDHKLRYPGTVQIHTDLEVLARSLALNATTSKPTDIVLCISCHGYKSGPDNYIIFRNLKYMATRMRTWIRPLALNPQVQFLALIDTCHSGSMLKLPILGSTLDSKARVCSISACNDQQSDMDDISQSFGFDGGLTAAVMDFLGTATSFRVQDLYNSVTSRLSTTHPQLRWLI